MFFWFVNVFKKCAKSDLYLLINKYLRNIIAQDKIEIDKRNNRMSLVKRLELRISLNAESSKVEFNFTSLLYL